MTFTLRHGAVTFASDHPHERAVMFGPAGKLALDYDASHFDDPSRTYRWVFRLVGALRPGDALVFAARGFERACVVGDDGAPRVIEQAPALVRDGRGTPLRLASTPPPRITILIATLDRRDLLEWTLWYLYETSTDEEREIWVWDNGSSDDTPAFLGSLQGWPGIRCFRSRDNLGLVGPRKRMLPYVQTPYVFTLDDDMWPLQRGWASAIVRAMDADPAIYQTALSITGHWHNNYGIVHEQLGGPFFRVPYRAPSTPTGGVPDVPPGSEARVLGGEAVILPTGRAMPFAVSGSASAWRTEDVRALVGRQERHPVCDLSEAWGHVLRDEAPSRRYDATMCHYSVVSPCPGPLWHLGRGERYWDVKCQIAPAIYNRSGEEQRSWLERARRASGWGSTLEDPDEVLPAR